jgi:hypothetical protein
MSTITKPFRVSYYNPSHVVDGRALLLSTVVDATNGDEAKKIVESGNTAKAVKAYPFYRTLKQPTRKTWYIVSGPDSQATKDVLKDLTGQISHDKHDQLMDTFTPKETTASSLQPLKSGVRFPASSVKTSVSQASSQIPGTYRWHGSKYLVDGRCTKLDPDGPQLTIQEPQAVAQADGYADPGCTVQPSVKPPIPLFIIQQSTFPETVNFAIDTALRLNRSVTFHFENRELIAFPDGTYITVGDTRSYTVTPEVPSEKASNELQSEEKCKDEDCCLCYPENAEKAKTIEQPTVDESVPLKSLFSTEPPKAIGFWSTWGLAIGFVGTVFLIRYLVHLLSH